LKLDSTSDIGGIRCKCREGYVASNGGKVLNKQDSCVECFGACSFDGHFCDYNRDCASGWCVNNICETTNLFVYESTGHITQADLIDQLDTIQNSGISVQPDGWIHLYGSTHQVFELSNSINVNKFTHVQYEHDLIIPEDQAAQTNQIHTDNNLKICFYESLEIQDVEECSSRCQEVQVGSDQRIKVGDIFYDRKSSINFVGFKQTNRSWHNHTSISAEYSRLGRLRFLYDVDKRLKNDDGSCYDTNARIVRGFERSSCQCLDGFMPSNGGFFQEVYDSCVDCFNQPQCPLDVTLREGNISTCAKLLSIQFISGLSITQSNATLVSTRSRTRETFWSGGTKIHSHGAGLSLYGNVTSIFSVPNEYTINEFSTIVLSLKRAARVEFIGFCLRSDIDDGRPILCINLAESNFYSHMELEDTFPSVFYNLALGKVASYSPFLSGDPNLAANASLAVDGVIDSSFYIDARSSYDFLGGSPAEIDCSNIEKCDDTKYKIWWEVDLAEERTIRRLIIHCEPTNAISRLVMFNNDGRNVFQVDSANKIMEIPNISASKIRILFDTTIELIHLQEVQVIEANFRPNLQLSIPLGRLIEGTFDTLEFVQRIDDPNSASNIADIKFF